jgi:uncharacterized membrane protein YesL
MIVSPPLHVKARGWYGGRMLGFVIKKTFFDMWDNMFRILLMNLGFLAVLAILFVLAPLAGRVVPLAAAIAGVGVAALAVYAGAASRMCADISDYRQPGFSDFWTYLKDSAPTSLLLVLALAVYGGVVFVVDFPFFASVKSFPAWLAFALLFWVTVAVVLALQYFFPVRARLDRKFRKVVKKSFLLLLDNPGHTLAQFLGGLLILVVSVFTALLLPGPATLLLWWNTAFKLRMYKYDWLEKNPGADRRRIPWDALLVEDRERVGKRSLKGMIFPWKE